MIRRRVKLENLVFSICYYPWILAWLLLQTNYANRLPVYFISRAWIIIGIAILIVYIIIKNTTSIYRVLWVPIFLSIGLAVSYGNDNASFLMYSFVLLVAARDQDFKQIVRNTMKLQLFVVIITILGAKAGIISSEEIYYSFDTFNRMRHPLGGAYASAIPNILESVSIEYLYAYNPSFLGVLLLTIINTYAFVQTQTRTPYILSMFCILIIILIKFFKVKKVNPSIKWLSAFSYMILSLISIGISFAYNPSVKWMSLLNNLLTQRLRYAQIGIRNWGISLFGTSITWDTSAANYNYVDSSYVSMAICYGVLVFIIFIILLSYMTYNAGKKNNVYLLVAFVIWAIRAIIDPQLMLLWFNPFLLYIGNINLHSSKSDQNVYQTEVIKERREI